MEEILHHLGWLKPYESWDNHHPWWCRILSINSILVPWRVFGKIHKCISGHHQLTVSPCNDWSDPSPAASFKSWLQRYRFYPPVQEIYNTALEHTPGNPPTQLWKDSLYNLLVMVKGCVPKVCWNNLRPREMTYPPDKACLKMTFLFPRWDMSKKRFQISHQSSIGIF